MKLNLMKNFFNQEFLDYFKEYFYDFDDLEEHAEHIAQFRARFGEQHMVNGKLPFIAKMREDELKSVNHGLNINIIREDDSWEMEIEVEEI